jgi:hypothetical protein
MKYDPAVACATAVSLYSRQLKRNIGAPHLNIVTVISHYRFAGAQCAAQMADIFSQSTGAAWPV